MKNLQSRILISIALLGLLIVGCEKNDSNIKDSEKAKTIEFNGLSVNLPSNYDECTLNLDIEALKSVYFNSKSCNGLKSASDTIKITIEEMDAISNNVINNYPDTHNLTESDIARIQLDFNGISEQQISDNIAIIDSFYTACIRYENVLALANYNPDILKSSSDYMGYDVSKAEFWALVWHPRLIKGTRKATDKAIELTGQYFPNQDAWRTKADAFRHALWNALIAKYIGDKRNQISECTDWAKKFTDKHEEGASKPSDMTKEDFEFDQEMDYHNNKIGRDYFKSVAWRERPCWLCAKDVKAPSEKVIADAIFEKTNSAKKVSSKPEIGNYADFLVYIKD